MSDAGLEAVKPKQQVIRQEKQPAVQQFFLQERMQKDKILKLR